MARRVWGTYDELDGKEKNQFVSDFEKALINLINGSLYEIWAAAYILSMQLPYQKENNKKSPFAISASVNNLFWETVQAKKEKLTQYYPEGPDGLNAYDDIIRLDRVLFRHYGNSYSSEYNKIVRTMLVVNYLLHHRMKLIKLCKKVAGIRENLNKY